MIEVKDNITIVNKLKNFSEFKFFSKPIANPELSIEEQLALFFDLYENLFNSIPNEGNQSHRFILEKTAEKLDVNLQDDVNIQVLIDEITLLREQLLEANQIINTLNK